MKNLFLFFIAFWIAYSNYGWNCAYAQTRENRGLADFHSVQIQGGFLVELIKGDTNKIEIHSSQLEPEKIITKINKKGTLIVRLNYKKTLYQSIKYIDNDVEELSISGQVKIRITHKEDLKSISRNGSGWLKVSSTMLCNQVELKNSGSGDIFVRELRVEMLEASCSGSGKIIVEQGNTKTQTLSISGSGKIENQGLQSENSYCNISGSGKIFVQVNQLLDAHISGTGKIIYTGTPSQLTSAVSGSGEIVKQ